MKLTIVGRVVEVLKLNFKLNGSRIDIREMKETDLIDVHAYASQPMSREFQPWGPNTLKQSNAYIKEVLEDAKQEPRSRYVFSIIEKVEEKLIGAVEINIRNSHNQEGEIGYILHHDYWGKGYATEAGNLILEFGFTTLKLHRIFATCDPKNSSSSRVLEKIGMTLEGRLREHLRIKNGYWRDSLLYSILENEWLLQIHDILKK